MKKLFIMALAAIFAANISAQDGRSHRGERKENKELKQEQREDRHDRSKAELSQDEETELEIKYFCNELYLDKKQAEHFAKTFREFRKAQFELRKDFKAKFEKVLNERQAEKVLRFRGGHPCKGDGHFKGEGPRKHEIKK